MLRQQLMQPQMKFLELDIQQDGATLSGFVTGSSGTTAWIDFTTDPSWANSTITARGALIYNSTKSNKAVAVLDFGSDITSTNGTFLVTFPTADASNALIRFA